MRLAASCILALSLVAGWPMGRAGVAAQAGMLTDYVELQRLNLGTETFVFTRRKFAAEFAIWQDRGGQLQRIAVDDRLAGNLYFLHALVSRDALYVIAYNTADTIPSGRSRVEYKDGIDLYRLERDADGRVQLQEVNRMLPVGGIDSVFYDVPLAGGMATCAEQGCILFEAAAPRIIKPAAWAGRELIEAAGDGTQAFGLFQLAPDDRVDRLPSGDEPVHFVCRISDESPCEALPPKVPAELTVVDGAWRVRYAESREERIAVLVRDLERSPEQRFRFDTNFEGRIAWAQVYVLEAFVDILSAGEAFPPALVAHARQRLTEELEGIATLNRLEPWFWSKRYSLERQRLATIVHLGRISSLVERARRIPGIGDFAELSQSLGADLASLDRMMERRWGRGFAVKRGVAFWLDGAAVPWNLQSAWVESMARRGQARDAVAGMAALIIEQERLSELPVTWRYAWGPMHDGWTRADNISNNTPDWEGNKTRDIGGIAHVSYRTMDARALLVAHRLMQVPLPPGLLDHLQRLVQGGRLRPSLSPELIQLGKRPIFDSAIARMHSRAGRPIQIQDQVWALTLVPATP